MKDFAMFTSSGTLPLTKGTLITCETSSGWRVDRLTVINRGASTANVNVYIAHDGGTSRLISTPNLALGPGEQALWENIDLQNDDVLEGDTDLAGNTTEWYVKALEYSSISPEK